MSPKNVQQLTKMSDDLYQEQLMELAQHPLHQGHLDHPDLTTSATNASCGDAVSIEIALTDPENKNSPIKDLKWQGKGCIISQATMSALAEFMIGKSVNDVATLNQTQLESWLGITDISIGRIKCLFLGVNALRKI